MKGIVCVCVRRLSLVNGRLTVKRGSVCIKHTLWSINRTLSVFSLLTSASSGCDAIGRSPNTSSWQLSRSVFAAGLFRPRRLLARSLVFSFSFLPRHGFTAAAEEEDERGAAGCTTLYLRPFHLQLLREREMSPFSPRFSLNELKKKA